MRHGSPFLLRRSSLADAEAIYEDARDADYNEWAVGTGEPDNFLNNLRAHIHASGNAALTLDEGRVPIVVGGAVPTGLALDDGKFIGSAWLVATNRAQAVASGIVLRHVREMWNRLEAVGYGRLDAWSDLRNEAHHRWMEWAGFKYERTDEFGPLRFPFVYYVKELP